MTLVFNEVEECCLYEYGCVARYDFYLEHRLAGHTVSLEVAKSWLEEREQDRPIRLARVTMRTLDGVVTIGSVTPPATVTKCAHCEEVIEDVHVRTACHGCGGIICNSCAGCVLSEGRKSRGRDPMFISRLAHAIQMKLTQYGVDLHSKEVISMYDLAVDVGMDADTLDDILTEMAELWRRQG